MSELSLDPDDVLSMKLSIEPTSATVSSLNELAGLSEEVIQTLQHVSSGYRETAKQASDFRSILQEINADKYASSAITEMPQTELLNKLTDRDAAIGLAQAGYSLDIRDIDSSPLFAGNVSNLGIENVLKDMIAKENGDLADQLSVTVSAAGKDIRDAIEGLSKPDNPRIFDNVDPNSSIVDAIGELLAQSEESWQALFPELSDIREATEKTAEKVESEPFDERGFAERLLSIGGRKTGNELFDNVMGKADKAITFSQNASDIISDHDDTGDSTLSKIGLISAGSRLRGFAGQGGVGSTVGNLSKGIAGVASKAAIPLAVASAAWAGINKGAEEYREIGQSGRDEGLLGAEAFTQGLANKSTDFIRGLNPFSSSSASDFANYRTMALNSGYNITTSDDAYQTFTQGMSSMKDMGIDPRNIIALFGKAIDEDPEFDVDDALKELADNAKDASMSIQEMAQKSKEYQQYLEETLGLSGEEAIGLSQEVTNQLWGEGGIFSKGEMFGTLSEQEQQGMLRNMTSTEGAFHAVNVLKETSPDEYQELEAVHGGDFVGLMKDYVSDASAEDISSLLVNTVAYSPIQLTGNDTIDQYNAARITGVSPGRVSDDMLEGIRQVQSGDLGIGMSNLTPGEQRSIVTVEVRMGEGLVGQISSAEEAWNMFDDYQKTSQSGNLSTYSAYTSGQSKFAYSPVYAAGGK